MLIGDDGSSGDCRSPPHRDGAGFRPANYNLTDHVANPRQIAAAWLICLALVGGGFAAAIVWEGPAGAPEAAIDKAASNTVVCQWEHSVARAPLHRDCWR
jgi:hypothetical protein